MEVVKTVFRKLFSFLGFKIVLPLFLEILVFAGIFYLSVSYIRSNPETFGLIKGPSIIKEEEDALIKRVGELIDLPKDERPTIATVSDKEKVKNQPFFGKVENGDKVLIYTNNKKVILYRPSGDRIVEVGAVSINQQETGTGDTTEKSPSPVPTPTRTEATPEAAL